MKKKVFRNRTEQDEHVRMARSGKAGEPESATRLRKRKAKSQYEHIEIDSNEEDSTTP